MIARAAATVALALGCQSAAEPKPPDPFADRVVRFAPGPFAGFGQAAMPGIVLGPPKGKGADAGSLDVVSLGKGGTIEVAFDDIIAVDGPGPDLLVFENAFAGFTETGRVEASEDGKVWVGWPCDPSATASTHCAGLRPVFSSPANGISPTDPAVAGGDALDLAQIGLKSVRYLRITDTGANMYEGNTGGFDLDAVAVVNGAALKK